MFVEQLRFAVAAEHVEAFIRHNRRWRQALGSHPGFMGQRTYRDADDDGRWLVIVTWRDRAAMEAFPAEVQAELERTGQGISRLERAEFYWEVEER